MDTRDAPESAKPKPPPVRQPLGCRDEHQVSRTLLRVVGREKDALDVAAFQSFVQ